MSDTSSSKATTSKAELTRDIALYTVARFGTVAAVAALLVLVNVPLLVALLVALVVALPASLVIFKGLRVRVATGLAEAGERRRAERAAFRAELRGEAGT
ncbi:DUF4229 domain-containing protein [Allokutzneria multivorans]|uniref:DUF4229 domain-containing protein n=1 Tax=Allokutzneria multivorans TaxID=1142134 RepID=UPI0031E96CE4